MDGGGGAGGGTLKNLNFTPAAGAQHITLLWSSGFWTGRKLSESIVCHVLRFWASAGHSSQNQRNTAIMTRSLNVASTEASCATYSYGSMRDAPLTLLTYIVLRTAIWCTATPNTHHMSALSDLVTFVYTYQCAPEPDSSTPSWRDSNERMF